KPERRRPLRVWVESARRLLVFGGFLSPPSGRHRGGIGDWLRDAGGLAVALTVWVITWVFPATFMIAMAWACESHSRGLFRRASDYYSRERPSVTTEVGSWRERIPTRREVVTATGLALSIAIPVGFLAYAIHVRNTVGINW